MEKDETVKYVRKIISTATDFKVNSDHIILVSAERALLSRLVQSGKARGDQVEDFKKIVFGIYGKKDKSLEDCQRVAPDLLDESGFAELEHKTLNIIYKKRSQILLSSILDDLDKHLKQADNKLTVGRETLKQDKEDVDELLAQISVIQEEIDSIILETDSFKKKAYEIVDSNLVSLKKIVNSRITEAFNANKNSNPEFPFLQRVTNIFGSSYEIKTTDIHILERHLHEMHRQVVNFIEYQFEITWDKIIAELYKEFTILNQELSEKSKPFLRKIEEVINQSYQISLNPLPSQFEKASIEDFYYNTKGNLNNLIEGRRKSNMNILESILNALLNFFNLGEKEEFHDEFKVKSNKYRKQILDSFSHLLKDIKKAGYTLINEKYSQTLEKVKSDLKGYSESYSNILRQGIKEKEEHLKNLPELLQRISNDIKETNKIEKLIDQNREVLLTRV